MTDLLVVSDLTPFATIEADKAQQMIIDAVALAVLAAPCLGTPDTLTDEQKAAAKAVLRSAVLRWNESGSGAVSSQTMGPFGVAVDTRQPRRGLFWPSEISELQQICREEGDNGGAFDIDTAPASPMTVHPTFGGHPGSGGWNGGWSSGWNDDGTYMPFSGW